MTNTEIVLLLLAGFCLLWQIFTTYFGAHTRTSVSFGPLITCLVLLLCWVYVR